MSSTPRSTEPGRRGSWASAAPQGLGRLGIQGLSADLRDMAGYGELGAGPFIYRHAAHVAFPCLFRALEKGLEGKQPYARTPGYHGRGEYYHRLGPLVVDGRQG